MKLKQNSSNVFFSLSLKVNKIKNRNYDSLLYLKTNSNFKVNRRNKKQIFHKKLKKWVIKKKCYDGLGHCSCGNDTCYTSIYSTWPMPITSLEVVENAFTTLNHTLKWLVPKKQCLVPKNNGKKLTCT